MFVYCIINRAVGEGGITKIPAVKKFRNKIFRLFWRFFECNHDLDLNLALI